MAKISLINRNNKREKIILKFAKLKQTLIEIINDKNKNATDKEIAKIKLQKLPRNASLVRFRNRCALTGRGRGYYRKFGLGRIKLREMAMNGEIPGITKASW